MKENVLIIVPVLVKPGEDTTELKKRIQAMSELGAVYLVNQGERIWPAKQKMPHVFIQYEKKPLGIWGTLEKVFYVLVGNSALSGFPDESNPDIPVPTGHVILNLAPLYFEAKTLERFICFADGRGYAHVVGRRSDIAASLSDDPKIGRARAMMECFLTTLASIIQTSRPDTFDARPDVFEDGFSGLHAFSIERYLNSKWEWVKKTTWGGALESQLQTIQLDEEVKYFPVPSPARTHASTLGVDMKAVVNMLDQARNLPVFSGITPKILQFALDSVGWVFASQLWLDPETAKDEIIKLLDYYNFHTNKGEFLKIK